MRQITILSKVPCVWGSSDCAYNTSALIEAMTGENLVPEGVSYSTPEGAIKALQSLGYQDLPSLVSSKLEEIPISQARIGDIVLVSAPILGTALGISMTDHILVTTATGLVPTSKANIIKAFKVP